MSIVDEELEAQNIRVDPSKEQDLNRIEDILKKRGYGRSKEELGVIFSLIKNNDFFKKFWSEMPEESHLSLLQEFQYDYIKKGQPIFQFGETGKNFYVLLRGTVAILAPDNKESRSFLPNAKNFNLLVKTHNVDDQLDSPHKSEQDSAKRSEHEETLRKTQSKLPSNQLQRSNSIVSRAMKNNDVSVSKMSNTQSKFRNSPKTSPTNAGALKILDTNDKNTKETQNTVFQFNDLAEMLTPKVDENPILSDEEILDRFPGHYLLNCLGPGSHFGEVALTHNVLRTATVICKEDCHLMKLRSRAYRSIISEYYANCEREKVNLLKRVPMIMEWPEQNLMGLMRQIKEVTFIRNKVIYDIGQKWDYFYVIKAGEVELIKEVDFNNKDGESDFEAMSKKDIYVSIDRAKMIKMNSLWNTKLQKNKKRYVRVALLGVGQTFGEEEVADENAKRKNKAVVVTTTAELLMIPIMKFIENAPNPAEFYSKLIKKYVKNQWRDFFSRDMARITEDKKIEAKNLMMTSTKIDAINKNAETINVHNITGHVKKEDIKVYKTASYASIMAAPLDQSVGTVRAITYKPNFITSDHPPTTGRTGRESDYRVLELDSAIRTPEVSEFISHEFQGVRSKRIPSALSKNNNSSLLSIKNTSIPPLPLETQNQPQHQRKTSNLDKRDAISSSKSPQSRNISPKRNSSTAYESPRIEIERSKVEGMSRLWKRNSRTYDRENRRYEQVFKNSPGSFAMVQKNAQIAMSTPVISQPISPDRTPSPQELKINELLNNDDIDDKTKKALKEEQVKLEKNVLYKKLGVDKLFGSAFRKASVDLTDLNKLINFKSVSDSPYKDVILLTSKPTDHSPKSNLLQPNLHTQYPQLVPSTRMVGRKLSVGELPSANNLNHVIRMRGRSISSVKNK